LKTAVGFARRRKMRRAFGVCVLGIVVCGLLAGCLLDRLSSPHSLDAVPGWDHAAFVRYLEGVFDPMLPLLEQTGDALDFERFRLFSGKALNGADETVVVIPLTPDSPSARLALLSEEEAPLAEIVPLPLIGFLALDPSTCFHTIENGVPYLCRILGYDVQAELVDAEGNFVRSSTEFSWEHRGNPIEGEWFTFKGNALIHTGGCVVIRVNNH
jgi:hypothetical protein